MDERNGRRNRRRIVCKVLTGHDDQPKGRPAHAGRSTVRELWSGHDCLRGYTPVQFQRGYKSSVPVSNPFAGASQGYTGLYGLRLQVDSFSHEPQRPARAEPALVGSSAADLTHSRVPRLCLGHATFGMDPLSLRLQ